MDLRRCSQCGYDTGGLAPSEGVIQCPECGWLQAENEDGLAYPKRNWIGPVLLAIFPVVLGLRQVAAGGWAQIYATVITLPAGVVIGALGCAIAAVVIRRRFFARMGVTDPKRPWRVFWTWLLIGGLASILTVVYMLLTLHAIQVIRHWKS